MNVNKSYKALLEGRISKSEFLRQARQGLPQYISNATSFEDAIKILRQKSILAESLVYQNKGDQFPLESIERGIRYELEEMDIVDVNSPTREEYKEAKQKAIDNLCKDPLYYIYKIAGSDFKQVHKNEKEVENDDEMKKVEPGRKNLKEGKYTGFEKKVEEAGTYKPMDYKQRSDQKPERQEVPRKVSQPKGSEDERKANSYFLELYCKYKDGKYQVIDPETKEKKEGQPLDPVKAAERACIMVRKAYNLPRFRPNRDAMTNLSVDKYKIVYTGERNGKPTFNQSWDQTAATRGRGGQISEKDMEEGRLNLHRDEANGVYNQIYRQLKAKYPKKGEAELKDLVKRVYASYQKKQGSVSEAGYQPYRGSARGGVESARAYHNPEKGKDKNPNPEGDRLFVQLYTKLAQNPEKALIKTRELIKDPTWKPSPAVMKNLGFKWLDPVKGTFTSAHPTWKEGKEMDIDKMVLKESVIKLIGKVLNEAATTNLAQFSDENASIADLPAAINSLENVVTEIESFWLKEQQKIQGIFDSLGNIKNEDGMPIGYKFAQPILESLKKDLAPVLEKITLDSLNLPEAPAPDQTQVNDPNAEVDPNDPNAVPPVPEKKTVFSPAKSEEEPLQEGKKNRRYTK